MYFITWPQLSHVVLGSFIPRSRNTADFLQWKYFRMTFGDLLHCPFRRSVCMEIRRFRLTYEVLAISQALGFCRYASFWPWAAGTGGLVLSFTCSCCFTLLTLTLSWVSHLDVTLFAATWQQMPTSVHPFSTS